MSSTWQYLVTESGEQLETDLGAMMVLEESNPIWSELSAEAGTWVDV
jgi:hypothetical protein